MALHHRPRRMLLDIDSSSIAPLNMNSSRESLTGDTNFDTNMVFILAALLCALICALGFNSIVRCALRCSSHRFAFETPDDVVARLVSKKGLKKSALHQIPIVVYGSGGSGITSFAATDCPICLGEFMDGEKIRVLPKCNHGFHVRCIDTWLPSHSSCPTCRQSLLEHDQTISETAAATGTMHHVENALGVPLAVAVDEAG